MKQLTNVRRKQPIWLYSALSLSMLCPLAIVAVPRWRCGEAQAAYAQAQQLCLERDSLASALESFEEHQGPASLQKVLHTTRELIPTECPALFAQAAVEEALHSAGMQSVQTQVGTTSALESEGLLARRLDLRGRASLDQLRQWRWELERLAGPVVFVEALLTPLANGEEVEFRLAANLIHRPLP